MRHTALILVGTLFAALLPCASHAQTPLKPAPAQAPAVAEPRTPPAAKAIFDREVSDSSKLSSEEAWAELKALVEKANKELDNIQAGISREIDSIDKAEEEFQKMLLVVNGIAERLKPESTFNTSLDKLTKSAQGDADKAGASSDSEVQRQAERFRVAAREYLEVKADAAVQYQKALSTYNNLNTNKMRVINEIKLKSHAKAAELCRQFVAEAKASLGVVQPLAPRPNPAVAQ